MMMALLASLSEGVAPAAAKYKCEGPVQGCASKSLDGSYGCRKAKGYGTSEGAAADAALRDCEEQLDRAHSVYDFVCMDTSGLTCG